jgi:AcrR family transcriptional regulator
MRSPQNVYNVNMPYHHGHLREALVDAAMATARTEGPDAVVLRAATRAAGVSPNAAYRHFADRDQLLGTVAARCLEKLTELIETHLAAMTRDPDPVVDAWQRLRAAGTAYIEFAVTEPGWFRTAFGAARLDPAAIADERNPLMMLKSLLDDLVAVGALPSGRRPDAEYAAWSAVHGIATLLVDGQLGDLPIAARTEIVNKVLDVVAEGL